MRSRLILPAATILGVVALGAPLAIAQTSQYKTPVAGKWKIQDRFEYTAGGSATIGKGGKKLTKLSLNVGEANAQESRCGTVKKVEIAKALPIKRVGSYKRPVVGRLDKAGIIAETKTKLKVDGATVDGTVKVIFEKSGKQAFTVDVIAGDCKLFTAIRK